jgi:hypothetical protein
MDKRRTYRAVCGHEGCTEYTFWEVFDRQHRISLDQRFGAGKYRCVRHSQPDQVLSAERRILTHEVTSRQEQSGRYFGHSGFVSGPGFKVFAEDFPPGTTLRVTAEIVLPSDTPPDA